MQGLKYKGNVQKALQSSKLYALVVDRIYTMTFVSKSLLVYVLKNNATLSTGSATIIFHSST